MSESVVVAHSSFILKPPGQLSRTVSGFCRIPVGNKFSMQKKTAFIRVELLLYRGKRAVSIVVKGKKSKNCAKEEPDG